MSAAGSPRRRHDLVEVDVVGQRLLYDLDTRQLHRLDETASEVWLRLDGRPAEVVAGELAELAGAPVQQVQAEVVALVATLAGHGLLEAS